MNVTVDCKALAGRVSACPSKSEAHRILICSLLSFSRTEILCDAVSDDIAATLSCIKSLGASVSVGNGAISVDSAGLKEVLADKARGDEVITLACGESGSTLRFFIPVVCSLGIPCVLTGKGRLPERPNAPLIRVLSQNGCSFDREDGLPLKTSGRLTSGVFEIIGNVSSQYISGLLFALPLADGDSVIKIIGGTESKPYIMITVEVLKKFGIRVDFDDDLSEIRIKGGQRYVSPERISVNGDWSNGAFWLVASELSNGGLSCDNLPYPTTQGDAVITDIIEKMNVNSATEDSQGAGERVIIDASQFPDLVPIVSVLAAARCGVTEICGAGRLRIKESNRIESVVKMIKSLGGNAFETENGMIIEGNGRLSGGKAESFGDHRIAMSAAIASLISENPVTVMSAEAVNKSYPAFFDEMERLGADVERSDG